MPAAVSQSQLTLTSTIESGKFKNPPWWNRRSRLERTLCGMSVVALLMFVAMAIALAVIGYHYQKTIDSRSNDIPSTADKLIEDSKGSENYYSDTANICLTQGCVKAAALLINNMDQTADPCKDFYKFSCGGWVDKQVIPEDKTSLSVFSLLQDELNQKLRVMVDKPLNDSSPDFIVRLKNMYESCMNLTEIEKKDAEPLKKVLKEMGGWPVIEGPSWDGSNFDWIDTLILFRKYGYSHDILLDLSVTPDYRNNTNHIVDLDQTSLGMPDRSYLLKGINDTTVSAYFRLMVDSAVFLGADRERAEEELTKSLNFEITLANFSLPREERRNISKLYNKMTVKDLVKLAPNINWLKYFNGLLNDPITEDELVIVNVPEFIRKFGILIEEIDKTTLANYMLWRLVGQSMSILTKKWRDRAQKYTSVITGKTREEPRWEQCMGSLTGSLGVSLASLYVRNHFKQDSKKEALEMVNYVHKEFLKILEEITWMDEVTREKAKAKAGTIRSYIGYPDELLNDTKISSLYENLTTLEKDNYFSNIQKVRKWSTDYAFNQLRKPNEKGDWKKHARAAVVNAYYNALENSIEFPAGILQGTFFDKERPAYMNYGAIGFVIGHEITHGFDDRGRQFDKDGNNVNWWDYETDGKFKKLAQCIIQQYGNYTVPENGLKINGVNTQGENIADNGGIKEAFRAYQQWVKDHGKEKLLPGLKYTQDQLFWISAANVWCGKYRPEVLKLRILSGSHSPAQFRVIGVDASNSPEFSRVFNCPKNSPMNPQRKCSVW
ncbi:neprilysin-2-like [Centruroides vittatus]|uniref:neprilysin-2-like n=1 Tax=Centruroides vittatus TaxID=120091 RepID=UPI0035100F60